MTPESTIMMQIDESSAVERPNSAEGQSSGCRNVLRVGGICIALCIILQVIYVQTLQFQFVNYDDNVYIYENNHMKQGLTKGNLEWAFTGTYASNWHPLTWISHMLDVERYGLDKPGGHHLTSVLFHTATAIVLLLALRRLTGSLLPSVFAAAVFAVHPLRVESVAWVAERKDVLSGFFFALTLLAYASYARRPSLHRYAHVVLAFVLGLLSKPMLVTVPFVLLLLDFWPLGRLVSKSRRPAGVPSLGWLLAEKSPLLILAVAASVITVYAQEIALRPIEQIPLSARAANAAVSYVAYIRQMFWPSDLAVIYKHPLNSLPWWQVIGAFSFLIGTTIGAIAVRQRRPYLLVGWLWYLGMLVPVIGLIQVGYQARADRYTYLPQIGLIIALTWWAADLVAGWRLPRPALVVTALSLVVVLAWCAKRQTSYWRDSESLFTRALACTTGNDIAHNNLGLALEKSGKYEEAANHFYAAIEMNPNDALSCINMGHALAMQGKQQEALRYLQGCWPLLPTILPLCMALASPLPTRRL